MAKLEESEAEHPEAIEHPAEYSLGESSGVELIQKRTRNL